jgi:hypothetical protein
MHATCSCYIANKNLHTKCQRPIYFLQFLFVICCCYLLIFFFIRIMGLATSLSGVTRHLQALEMLEHCFSVTDIINEHALPLWCWNLVNSHCKGRKQCREVILSLPRKVVKKLCLFYPLHSLKHVSSSGILCSGRIYMSCFFFEQVNGGCSAFSLRGLFTEDEQTKGNWNSGP